MYVRLGATVLDRDLAKVGTVERLIIDPGSWQIVQLIVKQGRVDARNLIIERGMVSDIDADGRVRLTLTSRDVARLRELYAVDYAPPTEHADFSWTRAMGPPSTITDVTTRYTSQPENTVSIAKGMDVQDRDFEKVGELEDIEFDQDAKVTGFTVRSGRRFRQTQSHFRVEQVAGVGTGYVRLTLSGDEARAAAASRPEA